MIETLARGRYAVERELGTGGMAAVHLARDTELDRAVAIKVLDERLGADERFRRRFVREARLAARLLHPNVVSVYDAGEEEGMPFIVMECVHGETLARRLAREGRLSAAATVDIGAQVCAGLEHAHAAGLVHRDVKPANLLLADHGTVKIADFGIARAAEVTALTEAGTILGTYAYLAPEQAAGDEVTPSSDLYSLGVVLYEALAGRVPREYDSPAAFLRKQASEPIRPIRDLAPGVPEALEDVVMCCLARNPAHRPESAARLGADLRRSVRPPETATRPLPSVAAPRPTTPLQAVRAAPAGRVPMRYLAAAAAAVAISVLTIVLVLTASGGDGGSPPPEPTIRAVPRGATPAEQARNLADWIRDYSG